MQIDNIPHVIAACSVLHNVYEIHQDYFDDEWLLEVDLDEPDSVPPSALIQSSCRTGGDEVRKILIDYFEQDS